MENYFEEQRKNIEKINKLLSTAKIIQFNEIKSISRSYNCRGTFECTPFNENGLHGITIWRSIGMPWCMRDFLDLVEINRGCDIFKIKSKNDLPMNVVESMVSSLIKHI